MNRSPSPSQSVLETVRAGYAAIATAGDAPLAGASSSCCGAGGGCCGPAAVSPHDLASRIGYGDAELSSVPDGANMGLSCGNPTAIAALRPGEVVLDLGSGGGFDAFIAGPKVGTEGRVIGVDMTPEMLAKARRGQSEYSRLTELNNVEFRLGEIENLPVANECIDVVISNCVLNLSPDKPRVWREIFRVLRPLGRVAISDLALLRPLPDTVRADVQALVGCIAGAALIDDLRHMASEAGLVDITLIPEASYIETLLDGQDPLYLRIAQSLPDGLTIADFITSLRIEARKP
jgi:arsenite methyltransferase